MSPRRATALIDDAERQRLWHGGSDPLPERIGLRAGPLSLTFEAGGRPLRTHP